MATKVGSNSAGAASQRADTQTLAELNQRSAGLGLWDVGIFRPFISHYTFAQRATGREKKGADFRCILVSVNDPAQYVNAHMSMRSDKMEPLQQAEAKFKADLKFRLSKVALENSAKQEYLHTPIKHKIDLAKTQADPLLHKNQGETVQPSPSMSINDCKRLEQSQRFDVTAIMDALSDVRSVTPQRQVFLR